jgi:hypothetical protein
VSKDWLADSLAVWSKEPLGKVGDSAKSWVVLLQVGSQGRVAVVVLSGKSAKSAVRSSAERRAKGFPLVILPNSESVG